MGQDVRLFRLYFKLICVTGVAGKKCLEEELHKTVKNLDEKVKSFDTGFLAK